MLAVELGLPLAGSEQSILRQIKDLEGQGYQFEDAEGTVELMMRRHDPSYEKPFELVDMMVVVVSDRARSGVSAKAVVKVRILDPDVATEATTRVIIAVRPEADRMPAPRIAASLCDEYQGIRLASSGAPGEIVTGGSMNS